MRAPAGVAGSSAIAHFHGFIGRECTNRHESLSIKLSLIFPALSKTLCPVSACPLIYINGFTTPGTYRAHDAPHTLSNPPPELDGFTEMLSRPKRGFCFHALNVAPALIPLRLQDAGGFQHHRPDFRRHERRVHGARFLQQLHRLQAAQGLLPEPAHQVRPQAN